MTGKDHFPVPLPILFWDCRQQSKESLERVEGHEFYYLLYGYSGYNQIEIAS
jgi:hypothetical protein